MTNLDQRNTEDIGGYNDDCNSSNRAVSARRRGLLTKSEVTRASLDYHRGFGVDFPYPVAFAKWLIDKGIWQSKEWHHTDYRRRGVQETHFYNLNDLEAIDKATLDALLIAWKAEKRAGKAQGRPVKGTYPVFQRNYSRHRRGDWKIAHHEEFTGQLIGDWIHLDSGGKKKASGKHLSYELV